MYTGDFVLKQKTKERARSVLGNEYWGCCSSCGTPLTVTDFSEPLIWFLMRVMCRTPHTTQVSYLSTKVTVGPVLLKQSHRMYKVVNNQSWPELKPTAATPSQVGRVEKRKGHGWTTEEKSLCSGVKEWWAERKTSKETEKIRMWRHWHDQWT